MLSSSSSSSSRSSNWIVSSLGNDAERREHAAPSPSKKIPTRLILHLDINETILLGDDAGGDTRHDSIQKMIAKSAFVQMPNVEGVDNADDKTKYELTSLMEPTKWWDGQIIGQGNDDTTTLHRLGLANQLLSILQNCIQKI